MMAGGSDFDFLLSLSAAEGNKLGWMELKIQVCAAAAYCISPSLVFILSQINHRTCLAH